MSAMEKSRAIVFWSAYYLPLLQIFLFALIDGMGFWVVFGSFVFVVAGTLFGTFREVKNLPVMSKVIAGAVFPGFILVALVLQKFVERHLLVGFAVFVGLLVMAVASSMQLHFAKPRIKGGGGATKGDGGN